MSHALWKEIQRELHITADGIPGPRTAKAVMGKLRMITPARQEQALAARDQWPTESQLQKKWGSPGTGLTLMDLPYPMVLSWDHGITITRLSVNKHCADSLYRILEKTKTHYKTESNLSRLGLTLCGGCYNKRRKRGGSTWSMHAWGAALDLDPDHNPLHANRTEARFAQPEYEDFFEIVESEGWTSLGREKDFDWMHIQAPRL